jgi:hypothetical protein
MNDVQLDDPSVTKDGRTYLPCSLCRFKSFVTHQKTGFRRSGRIFSDQLTAAVLTLSRHVLSVHETFNDMKGQPQQQFNNESLPEETFVKANRANGLLELSCLFAGCSFKACSNQAIVNPKRPGFMKWSQSTQTWRCWRSLAAHFLSAHVHPNGTSTELIRVDDDDKSNYYYCPKCDYKSEIVFLAADSQRKSKIRAYQRLVLHFILHMKDSTLRTEDQNQILQMPGEAESSSHIKLSCPHVDCTFSTVFGDTSPIPGTDIPYQNHSAWMNLSNHHFTTHIFPAENSKQFCAIVDGVEIFRCLKCDLSFPVEESAQISSKDHPRSVAYTRFLAHYISHVEELLKVNDNQSGQIVAVGSSIPLGESLDSRRGQKRRYITAGSYIPLSEVKCPKCDFVAKKEPHWEIRFPSQQVNRMMHIMKCHFLKAHGGEPIPDLAYRRAVISGDGTSSDDSNETEESMEIVKFNETEKAAESDSTNDERSPSLSLQEDNQPEGDIEENYYLKSFDEEEQEENDSLIEWEIKDIEDVEIYGAEVNTEPGEVSSVIHPISEPVTEIQHFSPSNNCITYTYS